MKQSMLVLLLIALMTIDVQPTQEATPAVTSPLLVAEAPILGIGRPKYNKNRIDRSNSVGNKNRDARRQQRRNGIGEATHQEYPNGYFWMLPNIDWKGGNRG